MIGKGAAATTDDGEHGGYAMSGALYAISSRDGSWIPETPSPPERWHEDLRAGVALKSSSWRDMIAATKRAAARGSERAKVLLANYCHRPEVRDA